MMMIVCLANGCHQNSQFKCEIEFSTIEYGKDDFDYASGAMNQFESGYHTQTI